MEVTPIRSASEHVASCWEAVLGTMPEATLAVRREAFRQLLLGRAPTIDEVAKATGLSMDTAGRAIRLVVSVGMAETIDSAIVGMDGLTTRRTRHRLILADVEMWTWCAYDIVGIAAALGADAVGDTQCGMCERPAEVVIRGVSQRREEFPDRVATRRVLLECDGRVLSERVAVLLAGAPGRVESTRHHRFWDGTRRQRPRSTREEFLAPPRSLRSLTAECFA